MFFSEELPVCNLASNSHQPVTLTYTLKLYLIFFSETVHCVLNKLKLFSQKAPYQQTLSEVKSDETQGFHYVMFAHKNTFTVQPIKALKKVPGNTLFT